MKENDCWSDFGFGSFGWGKGGGARRFKWRLFERGDLKFVILSLISEEPMHGYQVMQALEKETGPWYKPSPGSVYPTLQMLEDEDLARSREEDGKRIYQITDEGIQYLEDNTDVVEKIFARIGSMANGFFGKDSRKLTAAYSRLSHTYFEMAFSGRLGSDAIDKMLEVLDGAIEGLEEIKRSKSP